jgi:hypothetical protein
VSADTLDNTSISSSGFIGISTSRYTAITALAYFAFYLSALWDSITSSSSSSASAAISQLTMSLVQSLSSAPCQVQSFHFTSNLLLLYRGFLSLKHFLGCSFAARIIEFVLEVMPFAFYS